MKPLIPILLVSLLLVTASAVHSQVSDDFSDLDFTENPTWTGTEEKFAVNDDGQLQLNDSEAGQAFLVTELSSPSLANKEWRFWVKQSFSGSANNHSRIYLAIDSLSMESGELLEGSGYYIQLGESGSEDAPRLFRMESGQEPVLICSGTPGSISSSFEIGLKVVRDAVGNWQLWVDDSGGEFYEQVASGFDTAFTSLPFLGIGCLYTSSNADNFFFDDIYFGEPLVDNEPPELLTAVPDSSFSLQVQFSEAITPLSASLIENYSVEGISIEAANPDEFDPTQVRLLFSTDFQQEVTYILEVAGLADFAGNVMNTQSISFTWDPPAAPQQGDLVFTELLPDPDESTSSPNAEFVEIFNRSEEAFDLSRFALNNKELPEYWLEPGTFIVLHDDSDWGAFLAIENSLAVDGFPGLTNSGTKLTLTYDGVLIDEVEYNMNWYNSNFKADGGWSLEKIDPDLSCRDRWNWTACENLSGATPGYENSVLGLYPTPPQPEVMSAFLEEFGLSFLFPTALDSLSSNQVSFFDPALNADDLWPIDSVVVDPENPLQVNVFTQSLPSQSRFHLSFNQVESCYGDVATSSICVHAPDPIDEQQLVLNEILFDPVTGGSDYLEIYNLGAGSAVLSDWSVGMKTDGILDDIELVQTQDQLLCDGDYLALTRNVEFQLNQYPGSEEKSLLYMDNLPSFPNGEAEVLLIRGEEVVESFTYDEELHSPILNSTDGVSLERLNPLLPVHKNDSWHSASSASNYGTPGYQNSQFQSLAAHSGNLFLETLIFSPDQDGHQDLCLVGYEFEQPGWVATAAVFNASGTQVRSLINNELMGTSGYFSWDGLGDQGERREPGSYIISFESFTTDGDIFSKKLVVVLAPAF